MKLKNKITGEWCNFTMKPTEVYSSTPYYKYHYDSLAEFCEEWEDYEEPKDVWWLDNEGFVNHASSIDEDCFENNKEIGNYFETKEEAEKAVEKLKAWKRLKDKGLTFCSWKITDDGCSVDIETTLDAEVVRAQQKYITDDLNLLFGGEE